MIFFKIIDGRSDEDDIVANIFDANIDLKSSRNIFTNFIESCGSYRFHQFMTSVRHTILNYILINYITKILTKI